jgi:DNA-binding MarR family transcriptional regulator
MTTLSVTHVIERLIRLLTNEAYSEGLNPTQWEVLRYLAKANRFSRTPGALRAYLGITKGTISQTVTALVRKGFVSKTHDQRDKRIIQLALTEAGHTVLQNDPLHKLERAIHGMTDTHRAQLSETTQQVLVTMLEARGGHPFGACKTCKYFTEVHANGAPHFCGLLNTPLTTQDSQHICVEQIGAL